MREIISRVCHKKPPHSKGRSLTAFTQQGEFIYNLHTARGGHKQPKTARGGDKQPAHTARGAHKQPTHSKGSS